MRTATNARRREIRSLLSEHDVRSQNDLHDLLAGRGFDVTQATISRDLDAVGAERVKDNGGFLYRLASGSEASAEVALMHTAVDEFVVSAATSSNLIVLTVPPGAAQFVASRVDAAELSGVLGSIAGDDTILVIADEEVGATRVLQRITGTE